MFKREFLVSDTSKIDCFTKVLEVIKFFFSLSLSLSLSLSSGWDISNMTHFQGYANGPGDLGLIPGCVIPKTLKMVLDTSLLNTQQYKVCIKGKVEQFRERSSALPLHLGVVAIEKGAFWSPSTMVANFTYF